MTWFRVFTAADMKTTIPRGVTMWLPLDWHTPNTKSHSSHRLPVAAGSVNVKVAVQEACFTRDATGFLKLYVAGRGVVLLFLLFLFLKERIKLAIWRSHRDVAEDSGPLGWYAVHTSKNIFVDYSTLRINDTEVLWNVVNQSPVVTRPKRLGSSNSILLFVLRSRTPQKCWFTKPANTSKVRWRVPTTVFTRT
jgi:hypothetical protein